MALSPEMTKHMSNVFEKLGDDVELYIITDSLIKSPLKIFDKNTKRILKKLKCHYHFVSWEKNSFSSHIANADLAIMYQPQNLDWDLSKLNNYVDNIEIYQSVDAIIAKLKVEACAGGHFVLMSNGSFGGIYQRLQKEL